ncbi:hypothetical protein S245_071651, partial [Arachis hypogaea]
LLLCLSPVVCRTSTSSSHHFDSRLCLFALSSHLRICLHFDSPEYLSFLVLFFRWWLAGAHQL